MQVEVLGEREICEGKTSMMKEVEIRRFRVFNQIVFLDIALILVLATFIPNSVMVEGVDTMSTVPLSIR